jgi:alanyl-tRNA synthetase
MVTIKINKERRENLRRLHTATHILNWAAREVLGPHVWQNGSNLKEEFGTLDITHYKNLSDEEIEKIEKKVNEVIWENKKVIIEELPRTEAEKKYGFVLYQGGAIPMKTIRVVKIQDSDIEACGGTHMRETGGIGFFKLIENTKIQDGVIRLKYVVNKFALEYIKEEENILKEISNNYSTPIKDLPKTAEKFFNEWKKQKKEIEELEKKIIEIYIDKIKNSNENKFYFPNLEMGQLVELFNKTIKENLEIKTDKFIISNKDKIDEDYKKEIDKKTFKIYIL